jgi:diguanylate cyclase (GGDEF)-like protein
MPASILEKIRNTDNLPSLPTVAVEVLRVSQSDKSTLDDLVEVVQNDPAITGKLLKTVNSALFSLPREIGTLKQAVGLLGMRTVKVMALSFSLVEMMQKEEGNGFDFETYWRRSLTCAAAARIIAKRTNFKDAEEAFIGGLLADLSMVALWRCGQEEYEPLLEEAKANGQARQLFEIENEAWGVSHAQLTSEILKNWSLPESLCDAIGVHHEDDTMDLPEQVADLAKVIQAATLIASLFCQDVSPSELEQIKQSACSISGINETEYDQIMEELDRHVREIASMLSIQIGEPVNYAQIQMEATAQLAQLSMQAEIDRSDATRQASAAHSQVEQLNKEKKAILELASTDGLTKIANRAAFDKRLDEEIQSAQAEGHALGLILMDLDKFKSLNDTYGHQIGDDALRHAARCLNEVVKHSAFPARYGGEEFAVIVAHKAAEEVRALAEQIRRTLEMNPVKTEQGDLPITASIGVTHVAQPSSSTDPRAIIENADKNLYAAKEGGRNRVEMNGE